MATLQVRTDEKLKQQAKDILAAMGLDLSTAVNMYLRQIIITESIPFPVRTVNGFTPVQERAILRDGAEALQHGKRYRSVDALFCDTLGAWPTRKTHEAKRRIR